MGDFDKSLAMREGEDEKIALAGGNEGEEAAVGGDGEVTEGEAMKDGRGHGLAEGDVLVCSAGRHSGQRRKVNPHEVARFFFGGALQGDAGFFGGTVEGAGSNAHAC